MKLAAWFAGDPLPYLPHVVGFTIEVAEDIAEMSILNGLPQGAVQRRIDTGNTPYVGRLYGRPVGYGWVATGLAHIGELGVSFRVPDDERYLWDFEILCRSAGSV